MTTLTHSKPAKVFGRVVTTPHQRLCSSLPGGLLLGLVLFAAFFFTGNGLGASGGLNRYIVFVEDLIAPQHVDRTPYLLKLAGGSKDPLDDWVVFMVAGAMIGGFTSGWLNGRLKSKRTKDPTSPCANAGSWHSRRRHHGYGARMARAALGLSPCRVAQFCPLARGHLCFRFWRCVHACLFCAQGMVITDRLTHLNHE